MRLNKFICFFTGLMFLGACSITQSNTAEKLQVLPDSYSNLNADTIQVNDSSAWAFIRGDKQLSQLIDTALTFNFDLRIAAENIKMANAQLKAAKFVWLPNASINGGVSASRLSKYSLDGFGLEDSKLSPLNTGNMKIPEPLKDFYFGTQFTWELDVWQRLNNKKKAALFTAQSKVWEKKYLTTQIVTTVAAGYFEWLALNHQLEILRDNIELQQAALEIVLQQKEMGRANELAVELLMAQLLSSKAMEAEAWEKRQLCGNAISSICGKLPTQLHLDTQFYAPKLGSFSVGVPSYLLQNRADIKQAEFELRAAKADVNSAKAAFYPSLTITADIGMAAFDAVLLLENPASLAINVLGGITQPIFARKKLKAELLQSKANQKRAYLQYEKVTIGAFTEVFAAINTIKNVSEIARLKQQEVQTLVKSINTVDELFAAGRATYLEVITVQKNALQSQIDLIELELRHQIALVNLYRAIGGSGF